FTRKGRRNLFASLALRVSIKTTSHLQNSRFGLQKRSVSAKTAAFQLGRRTKLNKLKGRRRTDDYNNAASERGVGPNSGLV
ncbi:MAG TPA: hypothetical protein PLR25_23755, partial [Planctomycetaceae bacterium]|nr:hypothetical protein [Planctomycetaceae bacterium]